MKLDTQDLSLFGYDLSRGFAGLSLAWRDLLWGDESPLVQSLAEVVELKSADSSEAQYYRGRKPVQLVRPEVSSVALLLAPAQVLSRQVQVPLVAEADLADVMALEVAANSPFAEEDLRYGWAISRRTDKHLFIDLVIAHRLDIQQQLSSVDGFSDNNEVWAMVDAGPVVIEGYGEQTRKKRHGRRLRNLALSSFLIFSLLAAAPVMVSGFRYLQMEKVKEQYAALKASSEQAVELRTQLNRNNAVVEQLNRLIEKHPNPANQLQVLTDLAGDDVWLRSFRLDEGGIQITGYADNAADVMQQISSNEVFAQVKQKGGIRKDRTSGQEAFTLDISLRSAEAP